MKTRSALCPIKPKIARNDSFSMASPRVKSHLGVLEYLRDLNEKEQKRFIKHASVELLRVISELCLNLMKGTIEISNGDLQKLKKYKKQIIALSEKIHSSVK